MLINKFPGTFCKKSLYKSYRANFASFMEDLDEEFKFKDKTSRQGYEDWKIKSKDMQDEHMKRVQEMVRRKQEESKRNNKEFLMKMRIPGVNEEPDKTQVYSLSNGYFSINGLWVPGSVILFKKRFFMWGVTDAHDIKEHTLDILKIIKPRPNYLIIGTGKYMVDFDESFYKYFRNYKMLVEIMPTWEAVSHFNQCNDDDMDVCAAIIPDNL